MTAPTSTPTPSLRPVPRRRTGWLAAMLTLAVAIAPAAFAHEDQSGADADTAPELPAGHDYPTTAIADYVLGCMAANGNSYEALQQCSCSIDFIKARMDYKTYEEADTILQVQRDIGQRGIFYRDSNWAKSRIERLEALQAESTLRCF